MYVFTYAGVSDLESIRTTSTIITVTWGLGVTPSNGCGLVLYYIVTIRNSVDVTDMNITETSQTRAELSNLINGTSYIISVAAVNRVGTGPSSMINVTILSGNEGN